MKLTENAIHVLEQRYLRKDLDGNIIETPKQLMDRVANAICDTPELNEKILQHLLNLDFLPNSPTLMNAGTEMSQLSACFVISVEDNLTSIYDGVKHTALIFQTGGGVGATFEHIRPKGAPVKSTQGVASGPISFMHSFNTATETIKQGGKRRGAFMSILSASHPDIKEFVTCKDKGDTLANMNLSVSVPDLFMNAVLTDDYWNLTFGNKIYKTIKAKELFNLIVSHAHFCGDPGLIFIDTINKNNPGPRIESTNPCGEQVLLPNESCNLASIRLTNFIKNNSIDYNSLQSCIENVVEFLDLVIDNNKFPLPIIKEKTLETRKIGLGIMAWADALIALNIPYNSDNALNLAKELMSFINDTAHTKSIKLANRKEPFPKFNEYYPDNNIPPIRNANLTTIAPTGTISVIADCSSGIEPIFAVAYKRNLKDTIGKDLYEVNPRFLSLIKERNLYSEALMEKITKNHGSIQNIPEIPEDVRKIFLTAHDINYQDHVKMQAAFQKYTDAAVSKTINLTNSATKEDIYNAYILAWKSGCKGITIYRDGSKNQQVLTTESPILSLKTAPYPRPRYKDHIAIIREIETGCGVYYNGITFDEYGIMEDFPVNSGKGGCIPSQEAIGRAVSTMLRSNISPETIIKQFHRVKCNSCLSKDNVKILSCADGISVQMKDYHNTDLEKELVLLQRKIHDTFNSNKVDDNLLTDLNSTPINTAICKSCGSHNISNDKCATCIDCGASQCL